MIDPLPHIAAMSAYKLPPLDFAKGKTPILIGQNESAYPPSPRALAAAKDAMENLRRYPGSTFDGLREAIAKVHDLDPERIFCGNGSMELIAALVRAYCGPGDAVLSSQYGYGYFQTAAQTVGAAYIRAPEDGFRVSPDALIAAANAHTKLCFVANPGNPTGTAIDRDALLRLRDGLPDHVLLVIDEAYGEFADGAGPPCFDMADLGNTVVLRTFSKAYCLAGIRVGWGYFPPAVKEALQKLMPPGLTSAMSLAAADAAMRDQPYMRRVVSETGARRDAFADRLRGLGLDIPESATNFVLCPFRNAAEAEAADAALRAEGIVGRNMGSFGLPQCLRFTIGTEEEMDRVGSVLAAWVGDRVVAS